MLTELISVEQDCYSQINEENQNLRTQEDLVAETSTMCARFSLLIVLRRGSATFSDGILIDTSS